MRQTLTQAALASVLLFSAAAPLVAAAPSFKHAHAHHETPTPADVKTGDTDSDVHESHVNSKVDLPSMEFLRNPIIFEHKHQRVFKAAPGDIVIREVYDPHAVTKRNMEDDIILMTAFNFASHHHSMPSGPPRFHVGSITHQAPTGVDFTPISSLKSAESTTETPAVSPTSTAVTSSTQSQLTTASITPEPTAESNPAATETATETASTLSVEPAEETSASPSTQVAFPTSTFAGKMQSISYATSQATLSVQGSQLLGMVTQEPDMQFIDHTNELLPQLASDLLGAGISTSLITDYPIYNGSGSLVYQTSDTKLPLTQTPWMSRDNGKGGYLNGYQIFMYADTGVTIFDNNNAFGGFVSTSVAVDKGRAAAQGKAPVLQDMMGEWDNSGGLPRGFVPFTVGEAAYTGQAGKRYAIWPEASLIYLDSETALSYSSIVYIDTKAEELFADVGNTLVKVTVPGVGGPVAERTVPLLFGADHINFGGIGGIRSWGKSGPGGSDGNVYLFGTTQNGLMLARVDAFSVEDTSKYEYFNNDTQSWSGNAPAKDATSGYFVDGAYSNVDIFYSPRHLTFVMVFQTPYADNTFYWRYLQALAPIKPSYAGGEDDDIVENLHKYSWSDGEVLFHAPKPTNGNYIYSGGVQMGYFDNDDIVNGGSKMLLQWTSPTAKDDPHGYDTGTAVVTFA